MVGSCVGGRDGDTVGSLVGNVADVNMNIVAIKAKMEHRKLVILGQFFSFKKNENINRAMNIGIFNGCLQKLIEIVTRNPVELEKWLRKSPILASRNVHFF